MIEYRGKTEIELNVNGERRKAVVRPTDTLLRMLREQLGLTGPKPGCENGDCGACTVLLDGDPVKSCLILAVEAAGKEVTTVEGLKNEIVQQAYLAEGAFQCGYCTSGFLVNTYALLEKHPAADKDLIREWLSANLCRCTGYEGIARAVEKAEALKRKSI